MLFSGAAAREENTSIKSFVNLLTAPGGMRLIAPKPPDPCVPAS